LNNNIPELQEEGSRSSKLSKGGVWLLVIGILLIASNLRAAITSVGPVIPHISESTGLSHTMAGLLTTLPLIAFGLFSPLAPVIAKRISIEKTLVFSMLVLITAIMLRSLNSITVLFIGTFFVGAAIAASNVLLPSLIKGEFTKGVGLMMGLLSVVITLGAAAGSGLSVPLVDQGGLSWRSMLLCWSGLAFIALVVWIPVTLMRKKSLSKQAVPMKSKGMNMLRSFLAWEVTVFFGLQSLTFYVNVSWLPEILHDRGMSLEQAGYMVSIMQLLGIPLSFIVPIIAHKFKNQRLIALSTALLMTVGYMGLLAGGDKWMVLWTIMIGLGGSAGFSLALMFFVLRTGTAQQSAELSGMAQTFGYLLAAAGPILFGVLHDATNSWTAGLIMLVVVVVIYSIAAWGAADNKVIGLNEAKPKR